MPLPSALPLLLLKGLLAARLVLATTSTTVEVVFEEDFLFSRTFTTTEHGRIGGLLVNAATLTGCLTALSRLLDPPL
uniref:Putative secreted protein n=1 Tax=Anopheles marajoara TaxID=58244 RepID=A0A2M4CCL2_9DIPT